MAPERPITPPCLMAARSAPSSPLSNQNHQLYQYQIASPESIRIYQHQDSDQEEYGAVESREIRIEATNGTDDDLTSLSWLHDRNLLKGSVI